MDGPQEGDVMAMRDARYPEQEAWCVCKVVAVLPDAYAVTRVWPDEDGTVFEIQLKVRVAS